MILFLCRFYLVKDVVRDGPEAKEGSSTSKECLASKEELDRAARDVGIQLRGIAEKYHRELQTARIGALLRNINYQGFSTICNDVLRGTFNNVANCWDQTLLVFANFVQLRGALQGDTLQQNEIALYIGRYLSDMGFQSWTSWMQRQDDWVSISYHIYFV